MVFTRLSLARLPTPPASPRRVRGSAAPPPRSGPARGEPVSGARRAGQQRQRPEVGGGGSGRGDGAGVPEGGGSGVPSYHYEPSDHPDVTLGFVAWLASLHAASYCLLGLVAQGASGAPWWLVPMCGYSTQLLGYLTHWSGHQRWSGGWYNTHVKGHHVALRPARRFLSDSERTDERWAEGRFDERLAYMPTLVLPPTLLALWASSMSPGGGAAPSFFPTLAALALPGVCSLLLADAFHSAYHEAGHTWERRTWFQKLRKIHYFHHAGDQACNYALADFGIDFLFLGLRLSQEDVVARRSVGPFYISALGQPRVEK